MGGRQSQPLPSQCSETHVVNMYSECKTFNKLIAVIQTTETFNNQLRSRCKDGEYKMLCSEIIKLGEARKAFLSEMERLLPVVKSKSQILLNESEDMIAIPREAMDQLSSWIKSINEECQLCQNQIVRFQRESDRMKIEALNTRAAR